MSDKSRAWNIDNLRRAWGWIRSNPDRAYKSYFRELYTAYALADERLLTHLRDRLVRGVFVPTDACKIFFPKPSGILRPYSLLAIEDQIIYQAITNIVAEKLFPHVRHRYNTETFGHLYAGIGTPWFYRKWSVGYKAFNKSAEKSFNSGYVWTASFDLTAFYDSIDHSVLRHMLETVGVDHDLGAILTDYLSTWTATSTRIYHNHGIPQGPLSSGLISEVVLKHFDDLRSTKYDVKYFRYVDDIRLFAKDEIHLRHALVVLDRLSKDVGLFPQSAKIDIHEVRDIKDELKSLSNPVETVLLDPLLDQKSLRKRIVELSPRYHIKNSTRFKYLVARATPSASLLDRLWKIYERAPHFFPQLAGHVEKFSVLADRHAKKLINEVERQELYPAIRAALIRASVGRIPPSSIRSAKFRFKRLWKLRQNQPDLSDALWTWLCHEQHFTEAQLRYALLSARPSWLQAKIHFGMPWLSLTQSVRETWLNYNLRSSSSDVALSAAWISGLLQIPIKKPIRLVNSSAKLALKEQGLIRHANANVCGVQLALAEMTGHQIPVNWKKFFKKNYKRAEAQCVTCKGYYKTNPTAWVNTLDVFSDLALDALYRADKSLGTYNLGSVGSVLTSPRLQTNYPAVFDFVFNIHKKRLESNLSHAQVRATKKPTKPIKFSWLRTGVRFLRRATDELRSKGY